MKMSYLFFGAAFVILIATQVYPGAETWTAFAIFAAVGVVCLVIERRKPKPYVAPDEKIDTGYWKCPKCGNINPAFAKSCTKCGTTLGGALQP